MNLFNTGIVRHILFIYWGHLLKEFGASLGVQLYRHEFMSSCVSADLCCAVSNRESPREGGTWAVGQCWCLCNSPWVASGSLGSFSPDYHCCTHCWSERRADSLILSVGCTDRGRIPQRCTCLYLMWGKKRKSGLKVVFWSVNCASRGFMVIFSGNRGLGARGWLGVKHPCLCFGRVTPCVWMKQSWKRVSQKESQ